MRRSLLESGGQTRGGDHDLLGADGQRRREAENVVAGCEHDESALAARLHDVGGRAIDHGAEEKPAAPYLQDSGEARKRVHEHGALLAHVREQLVVDRVHDGAGGGTRHRVPAEGGAVVPGLERTCGFVGHEERAHRQPVGEALGERDEVRAHAELLEGEEGAGATDAGLDLVEGEERGELCRGRHELRVERDHASLAEDRLEQDQAHVVVHCRLKRVDVVRSHEAHSRNAGLERGALAQLTRRGERAERPPVEAPLERDDTVSSRRLPCVLERRLDRLGARVAEEGLGAAEALREPGRKGLRGLRAVEVGRMPEPVELLAGGRQRSGVAMAERHDRDPATEVEVLAAGGIPEPATLAADEDHVRARIRRQEPLEAAFYETVTWGVHASTSVAPISAWTPRRAARTAASSFGTMPPSNAPAASSRSACTASMRSASAPSTKTPGTSVTKTTRSASSPTASAVAASSALTFSGPTAMGATTGMRPAASAASIAGGRHGRGSPTKPSSGSTSACSPISSPVSGSALGPSSAAICSPTARRDSRTTARAASLVTRRPRTNSTGMPRRRSSALIWGPAPCTTTTSTPAAESSSTRATPRWATAPPSFTTTRVT